MPTTGKTVINIHIDEGSHSLSGPSGVSEIVTNRGSAVEHQRVEYNDNSGARDQSWHQFFGAQMHNGSSAEQVINFKAQANNNYELILNVPSASSRAQSTSRNARSVSA
ncbi:MAG TPA: hypothetical protein VN946_18640 [Terriglobales bacterium]|nr:hypothetical protein [Terriglobales bacterium]